MYFLTVTDGIKVFVVYSNFQFLPNVLRTCYELSLCSSNAFHSNSHFRFFPVIAPQLRSHCFNNNNTKQILCDILTNHLAQKQCWSYFVRTIWLPNSVYNIKTRIEYRKYFLLKKWSIKFPRFFCHSFQYNQYLGSSFFASRRGSLSNG